MSSSSNCSTAVTPRYTHPTWWTAELDKMVEVTVEATRIKKQICLGAHHFIVCDGVGDGKFRIAEWSSQGLVVYAVDKIQSYSCLNLGRHKLCNVWNAVQEASIGKNYSIYYNCNHWTENVALKLGYKIAVHWNCSCVTSPC